MPLLEILDESGRLRPDAGMIVAATMAFPDDATKRQTYIAVGHQDAYQNAGLAVPPDIGNVVFEFGGAPSAEREFKRAFATAVMAGSMGAALAALLGYESVARELRAQYILILAGPPLAIVVALGGGVLSVLLEVSPPTVMASVPVLSLCVCWLVALGLTFTGMLHLAHGAERERDPLDHLVDAPRTHYVPDRSNDDKDNLPPIKMEH